MEEEITLQGYTYIRKDVVEQEYLKRDNIQQDQEMALDIQNILNDAQQKITNRITATAMPRIQIKKVDPEQVTLNRKTKQTHFVGKRSKASKKSYRTKTDIFDIEKIPATTRVIYKPTGMDKNGKIYLRDDKSHFNIQKVIRIQKEILGRTCTVGEVDQFAEKVGLNNRYNVEKIAFSIVNGVFDDYIRSWRMEHGE